MREWIKHPFLRLVAFFNENNGAITALATLILGGITTWYLVEVMRQRTLAREQVVLQKEYLAEVKDQRILAHEQMVLQNLPDIVILDPAPFSTEGTLRTAFSIRNNGGPASEVFHGGSGL